MRFGAVLTIACLAVVLLQGDVGIADQQLGEPNGEIGQVVEIDPAQILAGFQANGILTLPLPNAGSASFSTVDHLPPVPQFILKGGQVTPLPEAPSHVYHGYSDGLEVVAMLTTDALHAQIYAPNQVIGIEPLGEGEAKGFRLHRVSIATFMLEIDEMAATPMPWMDSTGLFPDLPGTGQSEASSVQEGSGDDDGSSGEENDEGALAINLPSGVAPPAIEGYNCPKFTDEADCLGGISTMIELTTIVDEEFADHWPQWGDRIRFIVENANEKFREVGVQYVYRGGGLDFDATHSDIDDAFAYLRDVRTNNGFDARGFFTYKDYPGCAIGRGGIGLDYFLIQHNPDNCHLGTTPNTDFERIYLTKHEMGHNNGARHSDAWEKVASGYHIHRSIMRHSAWDHYHDIWSKAEADAMRAHNSNPGVAVDASSGITDLQDMVAP